MDDNPAIRFFIIAALFIVLEAAVIFMFTRKSNEDTAREKEAKWDYAVENGFTFYLDGQEVDPGTVSMKQYDVEFDEEAKKVFLTGKTTASLSQITVAMSTLPQSEEENEMEGYLTVKEAVEKFNVTARLLTQRCAEGRINGARKQGKVWLIPEDAVLPSDMRSDRENGKTIGKR